MSVKKEASGRRSVEVQIEVPGTPEEVWQAIATGPGISSWLAPAEFQERDGTPASLTLDFGAGMEMTSPVTAWEPPHRWVSEMACPAPGSPPVASEWIVEARSDGACIVRIVQSLFASSDDWDNQLEGGAQAWAGFLRALRMHLTHFRGQRSTVMKWVIPVEGTEAEAWSTLTAALGLGSAGVGERCAAAADAPAFRGVLEYLTENPYDALLRLDAPGPGVAALGVFNCGGPTMVALSFTLYGPQAAQIIARESPLWETWLRKLLSARRAG